MIESDEIEKGYKFYYTPAPNYPPIVVTILEAKNGNVKYIFNNESGIHEGVCPVSCLSGIPLTPEWIERCGFIPYASTDTGDVFTHEKHGNVLVYHRKSPFPNFVGKLTPMFETKQFGSMPVPFVHKLQIYYSDVHDEELEIKETQ